MSAVRVFGPNLRGDTETFHVHAAGCGDCRNYGRGGRLGGDGGLLEEFEDEHDLVESVYADIIAENDGEWSDYVGEFRVFPCVRWS